MSPNSESAPPPTPVSEHQSATKTKRSSSPSPTCPFCTIATTFPPQPLSTAPASPSWNPEKLDPPAYVLLSTPDVIAFLDIAPLTRGHVLVAPRNHRVKMGDLESREASELGRLLPLLARSVLRAVLPDVPVEEADYNIVQNNGHRAAQVVPHLHFHIIPRPPDNYYASKPQPQAPSPYASLQRQPSYVMFGRGQRSELDDDDAALLVREMRARVREEVERVRREEGVDLERSSWRGFGEGKL